MEEASLICFSSTIADTCNEVHACMPSHRSLHMPRMQMPSRDAHASARMTASGTDDGGQGPMRVAACQRKAELTVAWPALLDIGWRLQ